MTRIVLFPQVLWVFPMFPLVFLPVFNFRSYVFYLHQLQRWNEKTFSTLNHFSPNLMTKLTFLSFSVFPLFLDCRIAVKRSLRSCGIFALSYFISIGSGSQNENIGVASWISFRIAWPTSLTDSSILFSKHKDLRVFCVPSGCCSRIGLVVIL